MKKKRILLYIATVAICSLFALPANAQRRRMNIAEFEKRKIEYIQKEADLTNEEASKYFPIYNELSKKKFELYKQHRDKIEKMQSKKENMSNEEYRKLLENDMEVKLKEAELDKKYSSMFEKALSPEKLYRAQQAERKFKQMELQRYRNADRK